jgi:hypothetical protein
VETENERINLAACDDVRDQWRTPPHGHGIEKPFRLWPFSQV